MSRSIQLLGILETGNRPISRCISLVGNVQCLTLIGGEECVVGDKTKVVWDQTSARGANQRHLTEPIFIGHANPRLFLMFIFPTRSTICFTNSTTQQKIVYRRNTFLTLKNKILPKCYTCQTVFQHCSKNGLEIIALDF